MQSEIMNGDTSFGGEKLRCDIFAL